MSARILVYILRRDLRFQDNPIFYNITRNQHQYHDQFTHLLPIYVFPANQVEISGFLSSSTQQSPYPEARSEVAGFWRCGRHRAKFLAESVYDLQQSLRGVASDLVVRVGLLKDVLRSLFEQYEESESKVTQVWMTAEEAVEERREEADVRVLTEKYGAVFRQWIDEKYLIDDRDIPLAQISDLPEPFTSYRHKVEPLRDAPRARLILDGHLPPIPAVIPEQFAPFKVPETLEETIQCLLQPLNLRPDLNSIPPRPSNAISAHPFKGGEKAAHKRMEHLIANGSATAYKKTRNGMLGVDFSTKLSAWLAVGSITARQIHEYLVDFEDGRTSLGKDVEGYGKGENRGTGWIRFELLWRDYMRLCGKKYRQRIFHIAGMKQDHHRKWKYADNDATRETISRFLKGTTGISLIDASMRELYYTGYTSNRARQNVGSFLARHLEIDWRIGAEWYESLLLDYDVFSNWGNWQAVSITDRIFNPIKQSFDYDPEGEYCKTWVEELQNIDDVESIFQPWKATNYQNSSRELPGLENARPLKQINFRPSTNKGKSQQTRGQKANIKDK